MIMYLLMVNNHECSASPDLTRGPLLLLFSLLFLSLLCSHDNVFVDGLIWRMHASLDTRTSVVVVGFARECCGEIGHGQKPKS